MFTWICPKCGREVPPSYSDCPDCNPRQPKAAAPEVVDVAPAVVAAVPVAPPAAVVVAPPPAAPPFAAPAAEVAAAPPPPPMAAPDPTLRVPFSSAPPVNSRSGMPGWAIGLGFAVVLAGVLYVLFTYVLPKKSDAASNPGIAPASESASTVPGAAAKKPHPLAKFLEIVGIRWVEDAKQKTKMQFIVVNHSAANLPELKMQVTVKAGGKVLFEVPFTVSSIGPYESKEFSTPIQTALKGYELPDWQFVKAEFEITSQP